MNNYPTPLSKLTAMVYFNMYKRFIIDGHYFAGPNPFDPEFCWAKASIKFTIGWTVGWLIGAIFL